MTELQKNFEKIFDWFKAIHEPTPEDKSHASRACELISLEHTLDVLNRLDENIDNVFLRLMTSIVEDHIKRNKNK